MTFADGIAAVALGLGRAVVDGGKCLTFCPRYPRNLLQFSSVEDILANSQTEFWALELDGVLTTAVPAICAKRRFGLDVAESRRHAARRGLNLFGRQSCGLRRPEPARRAHRDLCSHAQARHCSRWPRFSSCWYGPARMLWEILWRSNLRFACPQRDRRSRASSASCRFVH